MSYTYFDGDKYRKIKKDIVKAVYAAWNYETDLYDESNNNQIVFSSLESEEVNNEIFEQEGFNIRIVYDENGGHLINKKTNRIYKAPWN